MNREAFSTFSHNLTLNNLPLVRPELSKFPRFPLANPNTPIESARHLSQLLGGPEIFIKRDDLTGLGPGGNKARKLEFLFGDALSKDADTIITAGACQSNHCCQTAAAAARAGVDCHLIFIGPEDSRLLGNRFLDKLFGAKEHWIPSISKLEEKYLELQQTLAASGKKPYVIPIGGSNAVGSLGYVAAMSELNAQIMQIGEHFDYLVFATGSGGTHAGIVVGAKVAGISTSLIPISVAYRSESVFKFSEHTLMLAHDLTKLCNIELPLTAQDFQINYGYCGRGYGSFGEPELEAISLLGRTEGILVDPVYTGKAMAGLISMARNGQFKKTDKVLFLHTGGGTALHAHADKFG